MKLTTWNVNSLNVRLPRLLEWLAACRPEVVGLQETKLEDHRFPHRELADAGYVAHHYGQRSYNGVALLLRSDLPAAIDVTRGIDGFVDEQSRVIAATIDGVRIVCLYVPNGQEVDSDKYRYKLEWCEAVTDYLAGERLRHPTLAVIGDFNIAPEDRDVHDPATWHEKILCSSRERKAFRRWIDLGLADAFRLFPQPEKSFSWWDYRQLAFPKNHGLRIDHILLSDALVKRCRSCSIDRAMRKGLKPSDHAPVIAEIAPAIAA